jgi:transcription initiation factor IIF auxiliary subunit
MVAAAFRNKDSGVEGFPLRSWSIEVYLLNEHGEQVPANVFDKVTYTLHPSFGERAIQSTFPFRRDIHNGAQKRGS